MLDLDCLQKLRKFCYEAVMTSTPAPKTKAKLGRRTTIIEAARKRFRKTGLAETTLEMVAEDAKIARPHLYRYFKDKSDLVSEVLVAEADAINQQRRGKIKGLKSFEEILVRSFEGTVETVYADQFWADIVSPGNVPYTAYVATNDPRVLDSNMAYWEPILEHAEKTGELREGLDRQEILRWLLALEFMFMERTEIFETLDDVRHYAETFVVPALVSRN